MLQLLRIIRILNSDASPAAIATSISLAMIVGLTPIMSLHNVLILMVVLLFRVHLGTFILSTIAFGLIGLALAQPLEQVGYWLLNLPVVEPFWIALYNTQVGRLSLFNYTSVIGGLFVSLATLLPVWLISVKLIAQYRSHFLSWMQKNRLVEILRGSTLIQMYQRSGGD
jgi:uncharacterized protein (TIGR03546 family)